MKTSEIFRLDRAAFMTEIGWVTPLHAICGDAITWTSENPDVAVVDENGVVTSKGIGECVITAGVEGTDLKEECTVKVELLWWKFFDNLIAFIRNLLMEFSIAH